MAGNSPRRGFAFLGDDLAEEPEIKYAMAFVDGQNLYQHAKAAFNHHHPNYDLVKLHSLVCETHGWKPTLVRFYTGIPSKQEEPMWGAYWEKRILAMKRRNIITTTRPLRYRDVACPHNIVCPVENELATKKVAMEKGVDVRLALDIVSLARSRQYDVAIIFSQDQDLAEVVSEVKKISIEQDRWIKIVSAFPFGPSSSSKRGINGVDWIKVSQAEYDACLDPYDYRPTEYR